MNEPLKKAIEERTITRDDGATNSGEWHRNSIKE
jgi:hypothetical protein